MNTHHCTQEFAATIGLDWADQKHDVWLCPSRGQPEHQVIDQTPEAIHAWAAALRKRFPVGSIAVGIETTRGALIYALQAYDFIVFYPINPKALASFRETFQVSGAKDDRTDAQLAEELVRCHRAHLRALKPQDADTRALLGWTEKRRRLVDHRTRLVNQCRSELKQYYPLSLELFDDLTADLAAAFLLQWPDLPSLKAADKTALRAFFYAHNSRSEKLMQRRLSAITEAVPLTQDPAIIQPARLIVQALVRGIQNLSDAIAQMDQPILEIMDRHPDAAIFRSFPAAGPALAPRLLVAFGIDRTRFNRAVEVAQCHGIAPVTRASGKSQIIGMRRRCPVFTRQTFHEHAACVVRKEPWARVYYRQQILRGKGHHAAIRATAFKLIRIYFHCWKNRTPYDAATYLAALQKSGSPLLAWLQEAEKKTND